MTSVDDVSVADAWKNTLRSNSAENDVTMDSESQTDLSKLFLSRFTERLSAAFCDHISKAFKS